MRLLLDTHAVMWMDATPERLSARVRDLLGEAEHDLFLSVVVVWELGIKQARGKLTLPEPIDEYVLSLVERARMSLLAIDTTHVLDAVTLPLHHGDPFDRMLVAQARVENLTLVTADPVIARYAVDIVPA
jgi:PIN domain nuclease of toxin-antitoxin system